MEELKQLLENLNKNLETLSTEITALRRITDENNQILKSILSCLTVEYIDETNQEKVASIIEILDEMANYLDETSQATQLTYQTLNEFLRMIQEAVSQYQKGM